ncbi:kinase-like domain-containing protein [Phyllosticta capitalensis]
MTFDTNVFAVLVPPARYSAASHAFRLQENKKFRIGSTGSDPVLPAKRVREKTPSFEQNQATAQRILDDPGNLVLRFDNPPKDRTKGWVFGANPDICDILLEPPQAVADKVHVSSQHFSINIDQQCRVFLSDTSTNGTYVGHDGQNEEIKRNRFTCFLSLEPGERFWNENSIKVAHGEEGIAFRIIFPHHHSGSQQYLKQLEQFVSMSRRALPFLDALNVQSEQLTPVGHSRPITVKKGQLYYKAAEPLGSGAFGTVRKVVNLEIGKIFAVKELHTPSPQQRKQFKFEADLMTKIKHPNIVEVIAFEDESQPRITMEFCSHGSLQDTRPATLNDVVSVLRQILLGVSYMHRQRCVHRDLKPANILVRSYFPFQIAIADFGLSKQFEDNFYTRRYCGTPGWMAPEIQPDSAQYYFAPPVDVFATGTIIYDLLPIDWDISKGWAPVERVLNKCGALKPLIWSMIKHNPQERLTAQQCLDRGCDYGLFRRCRAATGETFEDGPLEYILLDDISETPRWRKITSLLLQSPELKDGLIAWASKSVVDPDSPGTESRGTKGNPRHPTASSHQTGSGGQHGDSFMNDFVDFNGQAGRNPATMRASTQNATITGHARPTKVQGLQPSTNRSSRSKSPLSVNKRGQLDKKSQLADPSRVSKPVSRVTRSTGATAEPVAHQPYPMPPIKGSQELNYGTNSRGTEKKSGGLSRFWTKK